jgi:hypothetical protein
MSTYPAGQPAISPFGERVKTDALWRELIGIGRDQGLNPAMTNLAKAIADLRVVASQIPGEEELRDAGIGKLASTIKLYGEDVDLTKIDGGNAYTYYREAFGKYWLLGMGDNATEMLARRIPTNPEVAKDLLDYVMTTTRNDAMEYARMATMDKYALQMAAVSQELDRIKKLRAINAAGGVKLGK